MTSSRISRRFRDRFSALLSPRRTALRTPPRLIPPAPHAFARFGRGSWIVPPAAVAGAERIEVGDGVIVHENSALRAMEGARIILDDGVRLARGVTIVAAVSVILGKRVSTSDGVAVVDCWDHDVADGTPRDRIPPPPPAAVVIGDGAYLAAGAVVLAGVTVGARAFIGEGAVVATDVPANSVAYGNPARVVRTYDPSSARWQAC